jgi:two-component system nitrate/nitrite response regulator NarL
MHISATGRNDKDTLLSIAKFKPGVILLDLGQEDQNNLQFVKLIKKEFQKTKIIVINIAPLQSDVFEYVQAGVSGFILKEAGSSEFYKTVCRVNQGINVLPQNLAGLLFSQIVKSAAIVASSSEIKKLFDMTKRENEVIKCIAEGFTNKEIAEQLHLSTFTVKSHVHNILEKLSLSTRVQIAKHAYQIETNKVLPGNNSFSIK